MEARSATDRASTFRALAPLVLVPCLCATACNQPAGFAPVSFEDRVAMALEPLESALRSDHTLLLVEWGDPPAGTCEFLPERRPTRGIMNSQCAYEPCSFEYTDIAPWNHRVLRAWNSGTPPGADTTVYWHIPDPSWMGPDDDRRVFVVTAPFGPRMTDPSVSSCDLTAAPFITDVERYQQLGMPSGEPGRSLIQALDAIVAEGPIDGPDGGVPPFDNLCQLTMDIDKVVGDDGACGCPVEERSLSLDGGFFPFPDGGC